MAGSWEFNKTDPSSVRVELTQRDQFNNDDVGLADALVREVIQNSSDAGEGAEPVKVRFAIKTLDAYEVELLESNFGSLKPHFAACDMSPGSGTDEPVRVLSIEDFNTTGLTGSFEELDRDNFDNFWRSVGKSEKSGGKGGRWGLGKLVYSSSSRVKVFFGMTVRKDEDAPSLMGQAVLANHCIGDNYFPAHGFWFDGRSDNLKLQLPVQNDAEIEKFRKFSDLSRTGQPGLSIIIPHLIPGIDLASIISGVVNNYYFPILAGKLIVEVGDTLIDCETFLGVAGAAQSANTRVPFEFVKEISDAMKSPPAFVADKSIGNTELDEKHFGEEKIAEMKAAYSSGNLVHSRVPVSLKSNEGPEKTSHIDLFLQALPENESPFSLFARGPITLPGEQRYFSGAVARGAMIANDDDVAEFLGDAENPAHTRWNPSAEKLVARWHSPKPVLTAIRHSLRALYGIVAEQGEIQDDEALIDFFSLVDKAQASGGKKKKAVKPKVDVNPREKAIGVKPRDGGFEISAGPGAAKWDFPRTVRVRMAYDMIGANPFKRFSRFDFDLNKKGDVELTAENADIEIIGPNVIKFVVHNSEFQLTAAGFDKRRDLVVDARAL